MIELHTAVRPTLFLIPNLLGEAPIESSLPALVSSTVASLKYFLVEDERSARSFIKAVAPELVIRELTITRIPDAPSPAQLSEMLAPLTSQSERGAQSIGVISEAGCPAIADPGQALVSYAHTKGVIVRPLVGPCSMILALMGSGLNGQSWRFVGYLPVDSEERAKQITDLNKRAKTLGETQILMETPYRNERLLEDLLKHSNPSTKLCVAQGLTLRDEYIETRPVSAWRARPPKLATRTPCLFLIGE